MNRNRFTILLLSYLALGSLIVSAGIPLTESIFTEIIQEANILAATSKTVTPAHTNDNFKSPDMVRTGQASRVELTAKDKTITRVGANTTFAFASAGREVNLEKGSVLFHSPAGAGGGVIKNRGSSAAVLGTTLICTILPDGSFKVMNLEGSVKVSIAGGDSVILKPGQMISVSADGTALGNVVNFSLGDFVGQSQLVSGFSDALSSSPLIEAAIEAQNAEIAAGKLPNLSPFSDYIAGIDSRTKGANDPVFYTVNPADDGNPLDFPGTKAIGILVGNQLVDDQFLLELPTVIFIHPQPVTDVNPPNGNGP